MSKKEKKSKVSFKFGNQWSKNDTKTLCISVVVLVFWFMFEGKLLEVFTKNVVTKYISLAENDTVFFWIVSALLLTYTIFGRNDYWTRKRFIPYKYLIVPSFIIGLYVYYKVNGVYYSYSAYCCFGVVDWLILFASFFVLVGYWFNQLEVVTIKEETDKNKGLIRDQPIDNFKDDVFGFNDKAKAFVKEVFNTECSKRLSIGVNGKWGEGKSSFAKLMEEELKSNKYKTEFIVLEFNPRHSKNVSFIQLDFFQMLYEELSVYDSRFSTTFKKYLKAIQILDQHKVLDFIQLGSDAFFAKADEKQEINKAIKRLGKRIIIFIEDMDRLLAEEIMEVFKLIDGTAAFSNFIFITCFDKEHVSKVISKLYVEGEDTYFSDKFFDIEKRIPLIESELLLEVLKDKIKVKDSNDDNDDFIGLSASEKENIDKVLNNHKDLIFDILLHPRDIIRFVNMFKQPYLYFRKSVIFEDYLLLSLLKYKYNDVYRQLFYKKIVYRGDLIFFNDSKTLNSNQMYLNIKESDDIKNNPDYKIVELLFDRKEADLMAINHHNSYMVYFREYYTSDFSLVTMNDIVECGLIKKQKVIDKFIAANDTSFFHEFLYKVLDFKEKVITTKEVFYNYLEILVYVVSKTNDNDLGIQLLSLLIEKEVRHFKEIELISSEEGYKEELKNKLRGNYPNAPYYMIGSWIRDLIKSASTDDTRLIFDKDELLEINKLILQDLIESEPVFKLKHLDVLFNCLSNIDKSEGYSKSILDRDACEQIKKLIEENPKEYFLNFVRLEMTASSLEFNNITCIAFWDQIFAGEIDLANRKEIGDVFKAFISKAEYDGLDKITTVRNFWALYGANEYNSIQFEHQGVVQEKIDNELKEERLQLDEILTLQSKSLNNSCSIGLLNELGSRIKDIGLKIKLRDTVYNDIIAMRERKIINDFLDS